MKDGAEAVRIVVTTPPHSPESETATRETPGRGFRVLSETESTPASSAGTHKLELKNLSVSFGTVHALRDVSVDVQPGNIVMLVGPNGAGKSTLIRILLGLVRPDHGTVLWGGERVVATRAFKEQVGYLPEAIAFSENLTGQQVLHFFARARAVEKDRVQEVLARVGLDRAKRLRVRGYSRGMRQRLGLAIAILSKPAVLILDEPTGGLDQEGLSVLFSVLLEWRRAGRLVLMASHDLTLLERRVDKICILNAGRRVAFDAPLALRTEAALPLRVTLGTTPDSRPLIAALDAWAQARDGCSFEVDEGQVVAAIAPEELPSLMSVQAEHSQFVRSLRVEEPGLDEVYEQLLSVTKDAHT